MTDFVATLARHGRRPALILADGSILDYAALDARVTAAAAALAGDRRLVGIEMAAEAEAIVAYLAALRAGHAVALLPPADGAAWDGFARAFRPDAGFRGGVWQAAPVLPGPGPGPSPHPDLALLLLTSGSTGQGRGVRLSARAVAANAAAIAAYLDLGPQDCGALILPLHYSYGLSVLHSHLAVGASLWLAAGGILAEGFAEGLRRHGVTNLAGVPYSYELLESIGFRPADLPQLRAMTVAGGRLAPATVRRYHAALAAKGGAFHVMYGQTEATARIARLPPALAGRCPDSIGVAIPGGVLSLRDAEGRVITRAGRPGELVYRGPNVMMGYAEDRGDLARGAEVSELCTGDLAVRDRRGLYRIVGRLRRMSKIAGRRLGHDGLEAQLAAEGIVAAVVGDDRSLLAVHTGPAPDARIRARLAALARLPLHRVNACKLAALPRLASGKPDYPAMTRLLAEHRPPVAEDVARTFSEVFHPQPVSATDSFAGLGGDSLRHLELELALERLVGGLPAGWETCTVAELARMERRGDGERRLVGADLVIRGFAIFLVALHHATLWPLSGGSSTMVVLVGYGLARNQRLSLVRGEFAGLLRVLPAVLLPYYLILAGHALAWETVPWASVFLVGNFGFADPVRHSMLPYLYWFVEVFVQLLLAVILIFQVPGIRRLAGRDPFRLGLLLIAGTLILRGVVPTLLPMGGREIFTLPWVAVLAAFGWCAATATTRGQRLLLVALAALAMPALAWAGGNWAGSWLRYGMQFLVIAGLVLAPRLPLPAWTAALVVPLAASAYDIYLVHRFVPELLLAPLQPQIPAALFTLIAIAGGLALGLAVHALRRAVLAMLRSGALSRPQPEPPTLADRPSPG